MKPGDSLGHYRIVSKLGQGGMGEVYAAEDAKLGRRVALKALPPDVAADPERLQRFQREARAVAVLNHPNIVTLHTVEEADGSTSSRWNWSRGRRSPRSSRRAACRSRTC